MCVGETAFPSLTLANLLRVLELVCDAVEALRAPMLGFALETRQIGLDKKKGGCTSLVL